MSNSRIKWVRDEVLLALDLLLNSEDQIFGPNDKRISELSRLLQSLPIVSPEDRNPYFRNFAGVRRQILTFAWSLKKDEKASHVGMEFYRVFQEFENDKYYLNQIATAIKKCLPVAKKIYFADKSECEGFQEGSLLGHLHRYFEKDCGSEFIRDFYFSSCSICGIRADHIYSQKNMGFIDLHLLIPPVEYEEKMRFKKTDFVEVCPNCHRMLHLIRPWTTKPELKSILKTIDGA